MEAKFNLNLYFFHFEFDIMWIVGALRVLLPFNIFLLPAMTASYAPQVILFGVNCRRMPNRKSWKPRA
jgi:hypothetical protein